MTAFELSPPPAPGGFVPLWSTTSTPVPRFSDAGLLLGHGTRLVDFSGARVAPADDAVRAASLYAVAVGRPLSKKSRAGLETALGHWARGDKALAQLRLVFAELPRLQSPAEAAFLAEAADLVDHGVPPARVMKRFGLEPYEDLAKFNPEQPRVPAGSGRESGRWTDGGATAASASAPTLIEGASAAPPALSPAIFKPDAMASETAFVPVRAGGVVKPSAPDPQAAAAWQSFKESFSAWLQEDVPIYDQDTGLQYGTQSRERAILTNPLIVSALATVGLLGGEVVAGATVGGEVAAGGLTAEGIKEFSPALTTLTREELLATIERLMPEGMTNSQFGRLAGFEKGQAASSKASTVGSEDNVGRLRSAGVTRELVEAWALHYAREAERVSGQVTAVHRAPLLRDIWRKMR